MILRPDFSWRLRKSFIIAAKLRYLSALSSLIAWISLRTSSVIHHLSRAHPALRRVALSYALYRAAISPAFLAMISVGIPSTGPQSDFRRTASQAVSMVVLVLWSGHNHHCAVLTVGSCFPSAQYTRDDLRTNVSHRQRNGCSWAYGAERVQIVGRP
jgi:hypothetical protein